jgi:ribonuclease P protein component
MALHVLFSNFRRLESKQRYTFKKDEKLKSRKTIEQLFKEGASFSIFPFRVLWKFTEKSHRALPTRPCGWGKAPVQTGFAVSSKNFKKAVDRNRIKRLMREAYRLKKNELQSLLSDQPAEPRLQGPVGGQKQLAVFIIYVGNELPDHAFIFEKTDNVLKRLIKITNENLSANN